MPNVNLECRLLTAYVGHFYKAMCVTHCILEVGVRINSRYNQSHRVLVFYESSYSLCDLCESAATYSKLISAGREA